MFATLHGVHGSTAGTSPSKGITVPPGCGYRHEAGAGKQAAATGEPAHQAWITILKGRQEEAAFAKSNGCLPVKSKLPYKFPGGLDILKIQYDQLPNKKLLAFQSQFFHKLDPTFSIHLFGGTGYITTDPRNVETVCNSRFSGKQTSSYPI